MGKTRPMEILWLAEVEPHNYPAAESYLTLLYAEPRVAAVIARLKEAPIVQFKAKDIFRASRLSLLGISNSHVEKDIKKIQKGQALAPILLMRDEPAGQLVIADGYHRLCAIYGFQEDAWIRCKLA